MFGQNAEMDALDPPDSLNWDIFPPNIFDFDNLLSKTQICEKLTVIGDVYNPNEKCKSCFYNFIKFFFMLCTKCFAIENEVRFVELSFPLSCKILYEDLISLHKFCLATHSEQLKGDVCLPCEQYALGLMKREIVSLESLTNGSPETQSPEFSRTASALYWLLWMYWGSCNNECLPKEYRSPYLHGLTAPRL